jgi:hypothetical protein
MTEQRWINGTPHELNIVKADGTMLNLPTSGTVWRVRQVTSHVAEFGGIDITRQDFEDDVVPDLFPGCSTRLIVSRIVAEAAAKEDVRLFFPGPAIRDELGRIIGCKGLSVL